MIEFTSYKEAFLHGYKKGFDDGMGKGMEIFMWWDDENCPPANTTMMIETTPSE